MKLHRCSSLLIIVILLFPQAFAIADDYEEFLELDLEALMNIEVVTASRRAQKISEAPNAIYVITAEDIRRSGAVDLPDLFRMVPGVDVVNVHGNSYGLSARGFNSRFAQRMLVMIDSRSIYTTFFGGVFWENEQIFLEDIQQIEVIRGPGGTMWGANAVNGVINVITKDPEEDQGLMVTGKVGTKHFREGVIRYSDNLSEKLSFNITGGYREDQGARGVNDHRRVPKFTGRLKYKLSDKSFLQFFAGVNESEMGTELSMYTPCTEGHLRSNYQMLRFEHKFSETSQFHFQLYRDYFEIHTDSSEVIIENGKYDVEAQHSFLLGKKNQIVWGMNYRGIEIDSNYLSPEDKDDDIIGFFVQDELKILDNLSFIAGIKYERNSYTGGDWSPRGCILYSPWHNHHFRFSVSRSYTLPTIVEDSLDLVKTLSSPFPPIPLLHAVGNDHLDPEEMTSFELGYRTTLFKKVGLNVELYYNEIDGIIDQELVMFTLPLLVSWENEFDAINKGIEVSVDLPVTLWWTLKANYTFQEAENKNDDEDIFGVPKHKFNLWSSFTFKNGFSLDAIAHFVDDTKWDGYNKVDDYVRLDIRLSQKLFNDMVELSFVGQNLTDKLHPETSAELGGYEVERLIYGQVTLRF